MGRRRITFFLALLTWAAMGANGDAVGCNGYLPPSGDPQLVGFLPGIGTAMDVAVDGAEAFVASAEFGLSVVDAASAPPEVIGSSNLLFDGKVIAARGNRALSVAPASNGTAEIRVIDIAVADAPRVLGELATNVAAGNIADVALNGAGTRAVLALGQAGVRVVDISSAGTPSFRGSLDTSGYAYGVALNASENIAYVADGVGDLAVVSLTNPSSPQLIASLSRSGVIRDVAVQGNWAFLADQQGTLQVVDVTTPSAPRWVKTVGPGINPIHLAVAGTRLAALGGAYPQGKLVTFDISNPASPVLLGSTVVGADSEMMGVALAAGRAYVAAAGKGMLVYNVAGGGNPALAVDVDPVGDAFGVAVVSNGVSAYLADSVSTIGVVTSQ